MLVNTGSVSFWLGITFILISFFGVLFVFFAAKKKWIENDVLDKMIDLGKWFIVSVAVVLTASIVNDGFKERDQDIKEIEVFDKYTNIILEADSAEKRKLLSEYFSAVAPDGVIKNSWKEYELIVDQHIEKLKEAKKEINEISKKIESGSASNAEIEKKIQLEEKVETLNQSILPGDASKNLKPRVYFHIRHESQRDKAKQIAAKIVEQALIVPGIQRLDVGPPNTELRYFKKVEEVEATRIAQLFASLGLNVNAKYVPGSENSTALRPGHYELWVSEKDL